MRESLCIKAHVILVVVVNWNGAAHTAACLDSLAQQRDASFDLVVCDNASGDGSPQAIQDHIARQWGWRECDLPGTSPRAQTDAVAVTGFGPAAESDPRTSTGASGHPPAWRHLWLWTLPRNRGYAGGANAVVRWGLPAGYEGFWILNNDLSLAPDALAQVLVAAAQNPRRGPIGSVLMQWDQPEQLQALAGRYRRALAVGVHRMTWPDQDSPVLEPVDYPVGACLYAGRALLEQVGLMDEDYFLYYEEIDWAERARRAGFLPAVALRSRARHREGASTGSPRGVRNKSLLSEHFGAVNRLRVTRRFWPWLWPVVWASLGAVVVERLLHGEWARAGTVLQVMLGRRSLPGALARQLGRPG